MKAFFFINETEGVGLGSLDFSIYLFILKSTIANYPLTTPSNKPHPNSFKDTIRAGKVTFKYKTTYHYNYQYKSRN